MFSFALSAGTFTRQLNFSRLGSITGGLATSVCVAWEISVTSFGDCAPCRPSQLGRLAYDHCHIALDHRRDSTALTQSSIKIEEDHCFQNTFGAILSGLLVSDCNSGLEIASHQLSSWRFRPAWPFFSTSAVRQTQQIRLEKAGGLPGGERSKAQTRFSLESRH